MARFGFCSGFYQAQNVSANAQRCTNFIPEREEAGDAKSSVVLNPTPGSTMFAALPDVSLGTYNANGRRFDACQDGSFCEVMSNGSVTIRATLAVGAGLPISITGSALQLVICTGQNAYCYTLASNAITDITATISKALPIMAVYCDGFFLILFGNSQFFQVSAANDGTTWSGIDTYQLEVFPDNILSMYYDKRELWMFGLKDSQAYYNSGAFSNPFTIINGGYISRGIAAPYSPVRLDNSMFWIGADERGGAIAWRANGYTPARVSTHAIEYEWQNYPTIADAIGYTYQMNGHEIWVIYFPTANKTWCYDASTGLWFEWNFWNTGTGLYDAHHSRNHLFIFGKHLVGDWASANIYQLSDSVYTDNGGMIRRMRRAPYISSQGTWIFFFNLEIEIQTGLALQAGQGSDPSITVRWSDDRGATWGNDHNLPIGKVGDYSHRCILRRLGRAWGTSGRIFEVSFTDPIPIRIVDAYIEAQPNFSVSERLPRQIAKVS